MVLFVIAGAEAVLVERAVLGGWYGGWGSDLAPYLEHTRRWLAGGSWYLPVQLAGPYVVEDVTGNVYPPTLLYLTVPFTLGLPLVLWWAVPLGMIAAAWRRLRPAPWAWLMVGVVLVYPRTWTVLVAGNPAMWAIAFGIAGLAWGWPAVGAAVKLTFAPLLLLGIRHRRAWLVGLAVAVLLALPFGGLWLDYVTVLRNTVSSRGLEYVVGEWPIALALVAAAASSRPVDDLLERPGELREADRGVAPGVVDA